MDNFAQRIMASTQVTAAPITSEDVRKHFVKNGLQVRVKDLKVKFRINPRTEKDAFPKEKVIQLAKELGLLDIGTGKPGASMNGADEAIGYKPGSIRYV